MGQARTAGAVLPDPLPEGEQEVGAVLMLEQQIDLIDIDPGTLSQLPVSDDPVEDAVQHHQHPHWLELLAQVPDVIAEDTGAGVHIGGLGKGVEAALSKQLNGQSHIAGLGLRLPEQLGIEVLEGGNAPLIPSPDILPVALRRTAVNDGFLLSRQPARANQLLTQGEQELRLEHNGVLSVAVALLHVHGVDVVGRCGGDADDLAAQPLDEWAVFRLWVNDDNVIR